MHALRLGVVQGDGQLLERTQKTTLLRAAQDDPTQGPRTAGPWVCLGGRDR